MRPDRIIVGETRGGEALDMLQAMNTGHDGSMSTVHANRPREAMMRLENLVGMASANLAPRAIRQQIASRRRHDYSGRRACATGRAASPTFRKSRGWKDETSSRCRIFTPATSPARRRTAN
jgi:Flp pilus assembly CpaF family ATPase